MGAEVNGTSESTDRGQERGRSESTSSTSAESGRTTGRTDGGNTTGETTEKEKFPRLVNVEEKTEEQKREERNARRRARYAERKASEGKTVKPKKVNATKKKAEPVATTNQVSAVIGTVSAIVASRPNMAHWQLTPQEIESLSTPITNILAKSEAFANMEEHSDAIALVTACFTIILPRAILTINQMSKKKERKENVRKVEPISNGESERRQSGKDSTSNRGNDKRNVPNDSTDSQSEPFLGEVLAY